MGVQRGGDKASWCFGWERGWKEWERGEGRGGTKGKSMQSAISPSSFSFLFFFFFECVERVAVDVGSYLFSSWSPFMHVTNILRFALLSLRRRRDAVRLSLPLLATLNRTMSQTLVHTSHQREIHTSQPRQRGSSHLLFRREERENRDERRFPSSLENRPGG